MFNNMLYEEIIVCSCIIEKITTIASCPSLEMSSSTTQAIEDERKRT
jgi:hypothetical protein